MPKPIIAIVGRPNVGKSALFNKLIGKRISIVEDTPGVTRDRIYGESDWNGRKFTLIDTGGIEPRTDSEILTFMREQAGIAVSHADVIVFLTDIKTGLTASDQEVAAMLLRSGKPIVLAVNKMDSTGATARGEWFLDFSASSLRGLSSLRYGRLFVLRSTLGRQECLLLRMRPIPAPPLSPAGSPRSTPDSRRLQRVCWNKC